jgi:hypothetical protein
MTQTLHALFTSLASRLAPPPPPGPHQVAGMELHEARLALLAAEAESERARHGVEMLRERVARLDLRSLGGWQ